MSEDVVQILIYEEIIELGTDPQEITRELLEVIEFKLAFIKDGRMSRTTAHHIKYGLDQMNQGKVAIMLFDKNMRFEMRKEVVNV